MATRHNVHCWWLVANTSHFLQVLNDKFFARIKTVMPVLAEDKVILALLSDEVTRDCFSDAAYEAERREYTREIILASFKLIGLCSWDRDQVVQLACVNLGIGLSSDNVADQASAAAPKVIR